MVAGLLVMGGGQRLRSVESTLDQMLLGQAVAFFWLWSFASISSWVVMVATQGFDSASLQRPDCWSGAAPIWCTMDIEGDLPCAPVNFELFIYNKLCLVSSSNCCQFGRCESIALNNGFECCVAEIPAHAGGDPGPLPHFSAQSVAVCGVLCRTDNVQVLMVVVMSLDGVLQEDLIFAFKADSTNREVFGFQLDFALMLVTYEAMEASALYYLMASMQIGGSAIHSIEQDLAKSYSRTSCTCPSLSHDLHVEDLHVEDAVSKLFGLCHRRCTNNSSVVDPQI